MSFRRRSVATMATTLLRAASPAKSLDPAAMALTQELRASAVLKENRSAEFQKPERAEPKLTASAVLRVAAVATMGQRLQC
jgi:hypothetical protein